jgi:hypothetical protein
VIYHSLANEEFFMEYIMGTCGVLTFGGSGPSKPKDNNNLPQGGAPAMPRSATNIFGKISSSTIDIC